MIDSAVLDKLRAFDTPTICNLIEMFEVRPRTTGYLDRRISARFPEFSADGRLRIAGDGSLGHAGG